MATIYKTPSLKVSKASRTIFRKTQSKPTLNSGKNIPSAALTKIPGTPLHPTKLSQKAPIGRENSLKTVCSTRRITAQTACEETPRDEPLDLALGLLSRVMRKDKRNGKVLLQIHDYLQDFREKRE